MKAKLLKAVNAKVFCEFKLRHGYRTFFWCLKLFVKLSLNGNPLMSSYQLLADLSTGYIIQGSRV